MESQLSNALGLVKKYQKLAFLCHFENFLSLLVTAQKGHFRQSMDFLGLKSPKNRFYEMTSKCREQFAFYYFLLGISLEMLSIGFFEARWGHPLQISVYTPQAYLSRGLSQ